MSELASGTAAGYSPMTARVAVGYVFVASRNDQSVLVLDPETLQPQTDPLPIAPAAGDGAVRGTALGDTSVTRIDSR